MILRCLGKERVGFFSGHPVRKPLPPQAKSHEETLNSGSDATKEVAVGSDGLLIEHVDPDPATGTALSQEDYELQMQKWEQEAAICERRTPRSA